MIEAKKTEHPELFCGDVVALICDPARPLMTVWDVKDVGGEPAYGCEWLDNEAIKRTWHRRSELKVI